MSPLASPERQAGRCLLHREIKSATSTAIDFGANHPLHTIPAYVLPVYASQARLPPTTQDSVQDCGLGFVLATIAGSTCSLSFSRRNSLKFRPVGFPEYGFKRLLHPKSASASRGLKAPAYTPRLPRVGSDLRVSLQSRGPRAEALATTVGTMSRPRVLSSPAVIVSPCFGECVGIHSYRHLSARSSVLQPDLPGLAPPPDFAVLAYTGGPALRGCSRRAPSPSLLCHALLDSMPSPIRRKGLPVRIPIASQKIPVFALVAGARPLRRSR